METHGGRGAIYFRCYAHIADGIVFEKDPAKTEVLAKQRPTWSVYECDCEMAIRAGAGYHLPVNFVDFDPYGEPWPALDAYFESEREFPPVLAIAVNDGLRQKVKMNGGWDVESLQQIVAHVGARGMYEHYLDVCRELLTEKASQRGYKLERWAGYYCGHADQMTHYGAVLTR